MQKHCYFQTLADGREITFKESLANALFSLILYGIGYSFFFLAVANLLFVRPLPLIGLLASLAWITIMVVPLVSGCRKVGTAQYLGNVLGNFLCNRFVQITSADSGEPMLCLGYRCRSRRHYSLKLRSKGIKLIDWGPGQANVPGIDNDWNVALWFDVDSIEFSGQGRSLGIYVVGPSGRKSGREAFGHGFVDFLRTNHVHITRPPAELLGRAAEVVERLQPLGKIKVGADEYAAHTTRGFIERGSKAVIEEIRGTSIYVRETNGPNPQGEAKGGQPFSSETNRTSAAAAPRHSP
jgi:hypothetical protein